MSTEKPSTSPVESVVSVLLDHGWAEDGETTRHTVRIGTARSPVYGGIGGELATVGGRMRFRRGDSFATVGPRTVNFYERDDHGPVNLRQAKTKDIARVRELSR